MPNDLEERLETLENAHRALLAQHTALIEVFKLIAPSINMDRTHLTAKLTILYDTIGKIMQEDSMDDEHQTDVRHWLDVLSSRVLGDKQHDHPNHDE